jgi:putative CocE/NonD family hydrolase
MADGVLLAADRWWAEGAEDEPVILVRTPYGRREVAVAGRLLAERGYQVLIQSCRGTFGSGGVFDPFRTEEEDGRDTLDWLAAQPWAGAGVATFGASYLGLTQWSLPKGGGGVRAAALDVTASFFGPGVLRPGGPLALETMLGWIHQVTHQEEGMARVLWANLRGGGRVRRAADVLPLSGADRAVIGRPFPAFQDWLAHEAPDDPWWEAIDFRDRVADFPPATMVSGWYDCFSTTQLADYQALVAAGRPVRLTVGPWTHISLGVYGASVRDALGWFDTTLKGARPDRTAPVRVSLLGTKRWVDLEAWPPATEDWIWHLHPGGGLSADPPTGGQPDRYRYDPSHPTPSVGGKGLNLRAGPRDQRRRESRPDVLSYTSAPLRQPVTLIGTLRLRLRLRTSLDHFDLVTRLCQVSAKGRSLNRADGVQRFTPADLSRDAEGAVRLEVELGPTATAFSAGERIRLQVSSGAHPLVARNPGTGDPEGSATRLVPCDVEVLHDAEDPPTLHLPVWP